MSWDSNICCVVFSGSCFFNPKSFEVPKAIWIWILNLFEDYFIIHLEEWDTQTDHFKVVWIDTWYPATPTFIPQPYKYQTQNWISTISPCTKISTFFFQIPRSWTIKTLSATFSSRMVLTPGNPVRPFRLRAWSPRRQGWNRRALPVRWPTKRREITAGTNKGRVRKSALMAFRNEATNRFEVRKMIYSSWADLPAHDWTLRYCTTSICA